MRIFYYSCIKKHVNVFILFLKQENWLLFLRVYFDKKGILITKNQKHQQESSVRSKLMLILK